MEFLVQYTTDVSHDDPQKRLEATTGLRKLLSLENNPPIQQVINAGVVPKLIKFLELDDQPSLQFEATWAITNIASGNSDQTNFVVKNGAIPHLIRLLGSPAADVQEQAIWALGNLAGDSSQLRDLLLASGIVTKMIPLLLPNMRLSNLRNSSWCASNLCRGKPAPNFAYVSNLLPSFCTLIDFTDDEVVTNVMWAISYMTDGSSEQIQAVIDSGIVKKLINYLSRSPEIATPALRTIGNIVTGNDLQTQYVLDLGILEKVIPLFGSPKKNILKELCWMLSNVTAGTHNQIQLVIDHGLIPKVIDLLKNGENDVKVEACWTISNATNGKKEQLRYMFEEGCFPPLLEILKGGHQKAINVALECFSNFFKCRESDTQQDFVRNIYVNEFDNLGGADVLADLENNGNNTIADLAIELLDTYFNDDN